MPPRRLSWRRTEPETGATTGVPRRARPIRPAGGRLPGPPGGIELLEPAQHALDLVDPPPQVGHRGARLPLLGREEAVVPFEIGRQLSVLVDGVAGIDGHEVGEGV